ncbi:GCC2 and GCC3 family protein (macronuclear) [Tetrahymena thermophila SB210]|uniref:GCC2 and GCC3 family protein n=1 Tax=Tetrahymena thermophila (strain SB210) TaxID=312017 RepID=Q229G1_TETTS|nr:GCC2 and GCC3 family protein [Tetrahymena thermophila SB210]EAR81923.2 GCC2 and GCC3 family protein [Tetrahymena thermophila SB210]|eukprot:XP_001029586.2 GCC2 and GCC3 family protein [Tetrahymena thermophila SB210]
MKNQKTCLLFLALIQLSYQYCHYSLTPNIYDGDSCNCYEGQYTNNKNCFFCPNSSFASRSKKVPTQASDCRACSIGFYMTQAASSSQSAICSKCPKNSYLFQQAQSVSDESVCRSCQPDYQMIKDAISPSSENGNKGKAAQCQKCPNNTSSLFTTDCSSCAEGFYATSYDPSNQNANCQICPNNSSPMPPDQNRTQTSQDCKKCKKGFYNAETDQRKPVNCQKCPGNKTTQGISSQNIYSCICSKSQYITALPNNTSPFTCSSCPTGSGRLFDLYLVGDESTCDVCLEGYYLITPYQDPVGSNPGVGAQCQICPKNSYSVAGTSNSPSSCSLCKPNYYMTKAADSTNSAECQPCPNNTATLDPVSQVGDATQCTVCVAGYYMTQSYQDGKTAQCQQCPAGSNTNPGLNTICYCYDQYASWSTTQNSCQCNQGYGGSPATTMDTQGCTLCPAGQYSSSGVCVDCPAGTFSSSPGSASCTKCTSGQFATGKGNTSCQTCPSSTVSLDDFTSCKCVDTSAVFVSGSCVCPDGYEGTPSSSSGIQGCNACIAGKFSNSSTSGICTVCPAGKYSQGIGNTDCKQCEINTFAPNTGSSSCNRCGSGSTNNADFKGCSCIDSNATQTDSKSSCQCNSGFGGSPKTSQSSQSGCIACAAGQEVNKTSGQCSPCAAGYYSSNSVNQNCSQCSAGQYASGTGNSSCSSCPNGQSSLDDFSGCKCNDSNAIFDNNKCICKQGYGGTPNSAKSGSTGCTICPSGQYSDVSTQGQCIACPVGKYSQGTGNTNCKQCEINTFASNTGSSSCNRCGSGSTNNADFQGCSCIDSNATQTDSKSSCQCNSGFGGSPKTSQSSQSGCIACAAGQEVNKTSGQCSPCAAGYYSSNSANQSCRQCSAGQYASGTGNSSCTNCPNSYSSLDDFSGCKCNDSNAIFANNKCICKQGYGGTPNSAKSGSTGCTICQSGQYSDVQTQGQCIACPAGTYSSNNGSSSCNQCNEGQYASGTGNRSCQSCGSTLTNTDDFSGCKCIDLNAIKPAANPSCVCNSGYIGSPATSKNSQLSCTACPAGQFTDSGKCSPCGVGTFSSGTANSACSKCLAGQFANGTGNTKCQACAPGSTSTDDFSGCKCYDQNSVAWNASNNICQCSTNQYGDASKATEAEKSQCNPCPNNSTSKVGAAKTEKDCQVPQSQQNTQFSFSQILNLSIFIFLIIL